MSNLTQLSTRLTIIALLFTAVLLVFLSTVAWLYREKRGAKVFAILEAVSAVWVGLTILGLTTPTGTVRLQIWGITSGLSLIVVIFWIAFVLSYTGRRYWLTVRRLGVISIPLVVGAALYFIAPTWGPLVGDLSQETIPAGTIVIASIGPVGSLIGVYVYLVFLTGLGVVLKTVVEGSRLFAGQALAFVCGSLITIVSSLFVVLGVGIEGYPLTQVALGPQAILWGYAVFGQQFLQVVPAVAEIGERAVFDDLNDGILVVNSDGMVIRTNPQAKSYLDSPDPVGDPITAHLAIMDVEALEDLPTRFEHGRGTYQADSSEIRDWHGEPIGNAVIIRDVSQLVTREQRLGVLNRLLRHNVRNDMNVVLGIGEQLQKHNSDEVTAYGETLAATARELIEIGEKGREIDQMFDTQVANDRVDLHTAITEIVSELADAYPGATFDLSICDDTIRTDSRILRNVIEEVVSNALQHAGDAPTVQIKAISRGGDIEIRVTDDGPGIRQSEVRPITTGEETKLEHASSFGLWFIKWGTERIGGSVDITATDSGTQVTLVVPDNGSPHNETQSRETDDRFITR